MNTTIKRPVPAWNSIFKFLPASLLIIFIIIALDYVTAGQTLWTDPRPQLVAIGLIRTLGLAVSALLLVRAVISMAPSGREEPAMEEVSWFQRSFGIQTPEAFSGNKQNEMNLHNFASNASEIGYYFGSFTLFLLFPFVYDHWRFLAKNKIASFFAPSLTVLLASIPVMAFNYNLWNHPVTQFAFFATLFILIYYTFRAFTTPAAPLRGIRYYLLALCLLYPAMQIIFLGWGGSLSKGWEVTEYKEFLIPLTFFIYSLGLVIKVEKRVGLKYGAAGLAITLVFLLLRVMQSLQN